MRWEGGERWGMGKWEVGMGEWEVGNEKWEL